MQHITNKYYNLLTLIAYFFNHQKVKIFQKLYPLALIFSNRIHLIYNIDQLQSENYIRI